MNSEQKKINSNWTVTAHRYVGFIDIMGFKDMVARSSHDEIYELMKKVDEKVKTNASVKWNEADLEHIITTTFSDSIIIYSRDDSYESLNAIVCTVASLTNDLLTEKIPHKGAMAFGRMTLDMERSIFFGQPLIDAYLLQEDLNFYGFVIHATAEQMIDIKMKKESLPFLKDYNCPFKNGVSRNLTIYPIYSCFIGVKYKEKHDKLFESLKAFRFKTSGALRKYIDATEIYLNLVKKENKIDI